MLHLDLFLSSLQNESNVEKKNRRLLVTGKIGIKESRGLKMEGRSSSGALLSAEYP